MVNTNKSRLEHIDLFAEDAAEFLNFDLQGCFEKGYKAYEDGNYEEAAKYYLAALKHNIRDYSSIYVLASLYGLMGKAELSAKYLDKAVKCGFNNLLHIQQNEAFDKVSESTVFRDAIEKSESYIKSLTKEHGDVVYFDSTALFRCLVKLPEDYEPDKKYTLLIGLHGRGNTPEEFISIWKDAGIKQDFIFAAPQGHYPFLFNNNVGYSWNLRVEDDKSTLETTTKMSIGYITEIISELSYRLPVSDIYLAGFSQGASFALQTGLKHYEQLKGILSFSGFLPPDWFIKSGVEVEKAENLRVFISHGSKDRSVRIVKSREMRDNLAGCGLQVTFVEFDDAHTLPPDVVKKAYDWMMGK